MRAPSVGIAAMLAACGWLVVACDSEAPPLPKASTGAVICASTATTVALPTDFPTDFPLPTGVVPIDTSKTSGGVTLRAISPNGFTDVLHQLQDSLPKAGYSLSHGEVERDDAESNWESRTHVGRWAIRTLPGCPHDTLVQVFAKPK